MVEAVELVACHVFSLADCEGQPICMEPGAVVTSVWPEIPQSIISGDICVAGNTTTDDSGTLSSFPVRVIECAELLAADLFKNADQTRQRTHPRRRRAVPRPAGQSSTETATCGRCPLVSRVTAQQVYAIASGWQRQVRATRVRALR